MKKGIVVLIVLLCLLKLGVHLVGNQNYGFHRDELLHVSVSEHLAWGYMEFPPFIACVGKVATALFDHSLSGIRFFSTLRESELLSQRKFLDVWSTTISVFSLYKYWQ